MRVAQTVLATAVAAPWGAVQVAATNRGIAAIEVVASRDSFLTGVERRFGARGAWIDAPEAPAGDNAGPAMRILLVDAAAALRAAFAGDDSLLFALPLDLEDRPAWDRSVLGAVRAIPRGETRSYGDIARAVGRPGAARAVGGAVGRNPIWFVIPCHRVIAGDGTLGGYGGGWWGDRDRLLDLKAELLDREGLRVRRSRPGAGRDG